MAFRHVPKPDFLKKLPFGVYRNRILKEKWPFGVYRNHILEEKWPFGVYRKPILMKSHLSACTETRLFKKTPFGTCRKLKIEKMLSVCTESIIFKSRFRRMPSGATAATNILYVVFTLQEVRPQQLII